MALKGETQGFFQGFLQVPNPVVKETCPLKEDTHKASWLSAVCMVLLCCTQHAWSRTLQCGQGTLTSRDGYS